MKKILTILILSIIGAISMPFQANAGQEGDPKEIQFNPEKDGLNNHPKMPAYCPVYGTMSDGVLTVYSKTEGEASIFVVSQTGVNIASEQCDDLAAGYSIILPDDMVGLTVSVIFNGKTYSATL